MFHGPVQTFPGVKTYVGVCAKPILYNISIERIHPKDVKVARVVGKIFLVVESRIFGKLRFW